jgi:hypothetical protein
MTNPYLQFTVSLLAARQRRARWLALAATDPRRVIAERRIYRERKERKRLNRMQGRLRRGLTVYERLHLVSLGALGELADAAQMTADILGALRIPAALLTHRSRARSGSRSAPAERKDSHA